MPSFYCFTLLAQPMEENNLPQIFRNTIFLVTPLDAELRELKKAGTEIYYGE